MRAALRCPPLLPMAIMHRMGRLGLGMRALSTIFRLSNESFKACPACRETLEFRDMAVGVRGRKAHRAQEVPKYEYEKHRAPIKVEE